MTSRIILTFSNDKDNYLEMLVRERKSIYKSLQNYNDQNYVKVEQESNTTIEYLFQTFTRYTNEIQIFHYGGHAGGTALQFEKNDGSSEFANAGGLSELLGQQKELKLVFLNGCATKNQVESLLKCGVKAVIATSVPINDTMAVEFAEQFYQSLANQSTIGQSFATARAFVTTKYGEKKKISQFRDINISKFLSQVDEIPWGLYLQQENSDVLDWKLPRLSSTNIEVESKGISYKGGGIIHKKLLETLVKGLPAIDEDVKYMLEKLKKDNNEENKNNVYLFIVNSFPTPIGLQIRKLFANKAINPDRLEQLLDTYKATIELICFIMLSQLWDEKFKNQDLKITENERVVFNSFFSLNQHNYKTYNYYDLLIAIQTIFKANYLTPFIEEIRDFDFENADLLKHIKYMQELKFVEINKIPPSELERLCIEAEENLCYVLNQFLFIVKYKFVMVKNIELIKERHQAVKYKHTTLLLKQVEGKSAHESSEKLLNDFSDNKSVIVSRSLSIVPEFLNLSPFIIDENSLLGESEAKLFYFSHTNDENNNLVYRFLNSDEFLEINNNKYSEIQHLMDKFKKDLIDEKTKNEGVIIQSNDDDLIDSLL